MVRNGVCELEKEAETVNGHELPHDPAVLLINWNTDLVLEKGKVGRVLRDADDGVLGNPVPVKVLGFNLICGRK